MRRAPKSGCLGLTTAECVPGRKQGGKRLVQKTVSGKEGEKAKRRREERGT